MWGMWHANVLVLREIYSRIFLFLLLGANRRKINLKSIFVPGYTFPSPPRPTPPTVTINNPVTTQMTLAKLTFIVDCISAPGAGDWVPLWRAEAEARVLLVLLVPMFCRDAQNTKHCSSKQNATSCRYTEYTDVINRPATASSCFEMCAVQNFIIP